MNAPDKASDTNPEDYRSFATRVIALFALLGLVLVAVAVQVYRTVGELVDESGAVARTHQVKEQIVSTVGALREAEAAQRAYLIGGEASRLAGYYGALPELQERVSRLRELVADNPEQTKSADVLRTLFAARQALMAASLGAFQKGGLDALRSDPQFAQARAQDAAVDDVISRMLAAEDRLLAQRQAAGLAKARQTRLLTVAAIALCFAMLGFALFLILREQRRRFDSERRVNSSYGDLARSLEASRRLGDTLRQLSNLGEMLQGCRSLDEAATGLQVALASLFPSTSGAVNLMNSSQNLITPIGAWGAPIGGEPVFAPDDCWALRRGRAYPEEDSLTAFTCRHLEAADDEDIMKRLCVPLTAQGTVLGTLLLANADAPISRETRDVAIAAAEQISLAIANLRLQETLRTQSLRDPLTGLFNRRYLEVSLARDLARAIRRSQPLAVLMIDIDHFKTFNDTHGHDAGDALLAKFGELLGTLVRSEDVACRYGGEEFTILMQETDAAFALDRAEEIRRAVRALDVQHRRQSLGPVTVSIGIAAYPYHGDTAEQLLRRADRALYAAKNNGRDQVCVTDA